MDFGKYKYEAAVKAREARKNQTNTVLKEIRFRLKIDTHDYETKRGHAMRFLGAGDKVKAMIQFRGREQQRPEMGIRLLKKFAEEVAEVGVVESSPRIDGRNMVMVIGPTKNKAEAKAEARRATQRAEAKAANEEAKSGGEPQRVDTSGNSGAPLTQSLADLLPEGYSINTEPETAAPEAPAEETPAAEATSEAPVTPAAQPEAAPAAEVASAPQAAPVAKVAPARTSSAPRSTASRPSSDRPAASRSAAPAPRTGTAAPASRAGTAAPAPRTGTAAPAPQPAAATAPKPATAAPKPAAAAKPSAMPKPGAPKPSATPKPAGRATPTKSPASRPKPESAE